MPLLAKYVDDVITVSEREIALATIEAAAEAHLVLEPAGALAIAGARAYRGPLGPGRRVVAVGTGGNTTLDVFARLERLVAETAGNS
jgi:threonine dehydratase